MTELHHLTITELAPLIARREVSPVEVTEHQLSRIDALDGQIRAYALVTSDQAMVAARAAEAEIVAGRYRGPLHGIPIAVKDLCCTAGVPTMGGSPVRRDDVPTFDATVVTRLDDAGAISLGKANLTEGAMAGYHPDLDIPINPWGPLDEPGVERWAGVSSSGSAAAVAAGMAYASLGTDTGGSIRTPAAACGIAGLKPTYGRVSRHGVLDLAESLDHVGPFARSSADTAIVLRAIAGLDLSDPTSLPDDVPDFLAGIEGGVEGLRIGFDPAHASVDVDPVVTAGVTAALDVLVHAGATMVPVTAPLVQGSEWYRLTAPEAARAHAEYFPDRADEYGPYLAEFLTAGLDVTARDYAGLHMARVAVTTHFRALFRDIDVFLGPSMPTPAYVAPRTELWGTMAEGQALRKYSPIPFTGPANFAGNPTLSVPCGMSEDGMPLSVQFTAAHLEEALLCRVGHAYEQLTDWHQRHPLP